MGDEFLAVRDSRTSREYKIPISRNTVLATDFKNIKNLSTDTGPTGKTAAGLRVYDPGLQNTAVVESDATFADGNRGLLLFRGYQMEQLWESQFEEMLHLMVWGRYPTPSQHQSLRVTLATLMSKVPDTVVQVIQSFPRESPPMPMIVAGLAAYQSLDPDSLPAHKGGNIYHGNMEQTDQAILKSVAAYATAVGIATSHRKGIAFTPASVENTFYENLFTMMGLIDPATGRPNPFHIACFRRFAVLNCDHGMALSAFTMLVTTSSLTDPLSGLISSLAAAYGPLHFGAPEAAYKSISKIGGVENVPAFLEEVKAGKRRLFGYGHRTYKVMDPRVAPIKEMLAELRPEDDDMLKVAKEIDRLSATDEYFQQRGLHANADFYGVFFFIALGFQPEEIPIAMLSQRLIGVMAHYREAMQRSIKLFRPTHVYTGVTEPVHNLKVRDSRL